MKAILLVLTLALGSPAFATEITPENLVGNYKVEAKALLTQLYGNIYVLNTRDFEFQRTYPDGRKDNRCQGTYTLSAGLVSLDDMTLTAGKILQGYGTCPDDRQKKFDFRIEFRNTTMEDLEHGTTVQVRSSLSGGIRVNAYVKKQ